MNSVLVLGAGRSSSALIAYLLDYAQTGNVRVVVGDLSEAVARNGVGSHPSGQAIQFDVNDATQSSATIARASVVVSLLPAQFHPVVAKMCIEHRKHLVTASYVSDEMAALHKRAGELSLTFLNECGLDPGIDHMSAMQVIDRLRLAGHELSGFESFTGGLIAPETDPGNPWRYKFTWNSRNVVMAGQSTARYLHEGRHKFISYQQLFQRTTSVVVPGHGEFEGYANRDSLKYIDEYKLGRVTTMLRGTLRYKGFCPAWNVLVQLGCCDDTYELPGIANMTHRDFLNCFLEGADSTSVEKKIMERFSLAGGSEQLRRLQWSGLFSDESVGLKSGTPAAVLEHILNKKWKMNAGDNDMVVMWHRFSWPEKEKKKVMEASMVVKGTDAVNTAMARTVGIPLGIATRLILEGKIVRRGVVIPTSPDIYQPILDELKSHGIALSEREIAS
jgi:saccharopine dehydrogenase-like NADP-dependent oxidoreductase